MERNVNINNSILGISDFFVEMALKTVAEEYFGSINPIAARIRTDMEEIKSSYEELWFTLSEDEKEHILCESIIKPEVLLKYGPQEGKEERSQYATKLVIDDHCSYRDEHSGPFSFRTQSQRDLSIFQKEKKKPNGRQNVAVRKAPKAAKKPAPTPVINQVDLYENRDEIDYPDECSSRNSTLPKTGLDFLDNW